MVIEYIVEFTSYLNAHDDGFSITSEKIKRFFEMMAQEDLDFTNEADVLGIMKAVFCTSYDQYILIESYFKNYYKDRENFEHYLQLKKQKQQWQTKQESFNYAYIEKKQIYDDSINYLQQIMNNEFTAIELEIYGHKEQYINMSMPKKTMKLKKKDASFIADMINDDGQIKDVRLSNNQKKFVKHVFINCDTNILYDCYNNQFESINGKIAKACENALMDNDIELFERLEKLFQIFDNLMKQVNQYKRKRAKINKNTDEQLEQIIKKKQNVIRHSYQQQMEAYKFMMNELEDERHIIQSNIDKLNMQMQHIHTDFKTIEKTQSIHHREDFIGRNAVIAYGYDEQTQKLLNKNFDTLSAEDKNNLYYYIKKNIMNFKTRMTRHIHTNETRHIDIQATIQNTIKSCGLPLQLNYQKPKANKTKLVLILDVSGSCKEAAQMMLTFMYILKSVFPGGCKTFAFVNTLYDISAVMESSDIETSIENTMELIPRRGVYSNYYTPFKCIWEGHRQDITSDSIVIVIGDARNNHNPMGEEIIKNIARCVKKAYWLNTEPVDKWDKADSLASVYGKYFKMYETLNTGDLIRFIQIIA